MTSTRTFFGLLQGAALATGFVMMANGAHAAFIGLQASNTSLNVGDSVSISLEISGLSHTATDSLDAFDINLLFDNTAFDLTGYSFADPVLGNQLDLPGDPLDFGFLGNASATGGVVDAYGISGNDFSFLDANQATDFTFLTLVFKATAETVGSGFTLDLSDPTLSFLNTTYTDDLPVSYATITATVSVSNGSGGTVDEPSATVLVLTALLPLLLIYKRGRRQSASTRSLI